MIGLVDAFKTVVFPVMVEIGSILAVVSLITVAYKVMRVSNWQQAIDKIKTIFLAYAMVKGAFTIISFVDRLIDNIKI